uniref:Hexosyltransferase n=1 Tax=Rhipicephalus pulchellus TaxID=72859 RepID=L7LXR2_RHIPC
MSRFTQHASEIAKPHSRTYNVKLFRRSPWQCIHLVMKPPAILTPKRSILVLAFLLLIVVVQLSVYQVRLRSSSTRCSATSKAVRFEYVTRVARPCERTTNRTTVLIGVTSSVDHFESRAAIRDTWGGTAVRMGFVVVFLLGATLDQKVQRKVLAEHEIHGDVVQGDFVDSYDNLTYKTVMLIRWAREECSKTEFVLKIDDDMILSVWDLAVVVNGLGETKRSMWGYLYTNGKPNRNVASKWYVSREKYAPDTYPDFLSGTGYLISGDAISALDDVIYDECFFPLEDIYLTAIVAERAQVSRLRLDGFSNEHNWYYQPCSNPRVVTSHGWSPKALRDEWRRAVDRLNFSLCVGIKHHQMVS